jgi:hypothetical protein
MRGHLYLLPMLTLDASCYQLPASTIYRAGDLVTVTGTGLTGATVTINDVACVVVNVSDTSLNFTYPALVGWFI